jgi:predicted HTH domain antitoxin
MKNEVEGVSGLNRKRYTAIRLYQEKRLSIGQCAELAEMAEEDFIKLLGKEKISIFDFNSTAEINEDLANA